MELDMQEKQDRLFTKIRNSHGIQTLSGYVQNDFERMLEDGYITKQEIRDSIPEMEKDFDKEIERLEQLKQETKTILEYYGKE